jgi:hypothetical protein
MALAEGQDLVPLTLRVEEGGQAVEKQFDGRPRAAALAPLAMGTPGNWLEGLSVAAAKGMLAERWADRKM